MGLLLSLAPYSCCPSLCPSPFSRCFYISSTISSSYSLCSHVYPAPLPAKLFCHSKYRHSNLYFSTDYAASSSLYPLHQTIQTFRPIFSCCIIFYTSFAFCSSYVSPLFSHSLEDPRFSDFPNQLPFINSSEYSPSLSETLKDTQNFLIITQKKLFIPHPSSQTSSPSTLSYC